MESIDVARMRASWGVAWGFGLVGVWLGFLSGTWTEAWLVVPPGKGLVTRGMAMLIYATTFHLAGRWQDTRRDGDVGRALLRVLFVNVAALSTVVVILVFTPAASLVRSQAWALSLVHGLIIPFAGLPGCAAILHADAHFGERACSLLAGCRRAAFAMAILTVGVLTPWWLANRRMHVGAVLLLFTVVAIALALHATALRRQLRMMERVFSRASTAGEDAWLVADHGWDVGVGHDVKVLPSTIQSYRRMPTAGPVLIGDCNHAAAKLRGLTWWALALASWAVLQLGALALRGPL